MRLLYAPRCPTIRSDSFHANRELESLESATLDVFTNLEEGQEFSIIHENLCLLIPSLPPVFYGATRTNHNGISINNAKLWITTAPPAEAVYFMSITLSYSIFWAKHPEVASHLGEVITPPKSFITPRWEYPATLVPEGCDFVTSTASSVSSYQEEVVDRKGFGVLLLSSLSSPSGIYPGYKLRTFRWVVPVYLSTDLFNRKGLKSLLQQAIIKSQINIDILSAYALSH